ncbi:MAG: carboxypeptidase-like regulatory domain-containing protein, partial [Bacteroidetes bacterium]|nr:carboxypeptidase-like regulatory domain-containing protein [Bacteroidota bacterium]
MRIIFSLFLLLFTTTAYAQVKGKVFGERGTEKEILPGAKVCWLGSKDSVLVNDYGVFEIGTASNGTQKLLVSFEGYMTDTFFVGSK